MSRNVIDSLKAWNRKRRVPRLVETQDFEHDVRKLDNATRTPVWWQVDPSGWDQKPAAYLGMEEEWQPEIAPFSAAPVAKCQVVAFKGDQAECSVILDGFELPRVSFPAWVLKQKTLGIGGRFHWIMRDGSRVRPADIDPDVRQTDNLTAQEKATLDRLYEESKRRRAEDGGKWPEFTGPGR